MSLSKTPAAERVMTTSTTVPFTTPTETPPPVPSLSSSKPSSSSSSAPGTLSSQPTGTRPVSSSSSSSSGLPGPLSPRVAQSVSAAEYRNAHKWCQLNPLSTATPKPHSSLWTHPPLTVCCAVCHCCDAAVLCRDACVENSLVKTGYGLLLAGAAALLLFRSPAARACVAGLGGGFGAGMSWVECKQSFAAEQVVRPQLSTLHVPKLPNVSAATSSTPNSNSLTLTAENK